MKKRVTLAIASTLHTGGRGFASEAAAAAVCYAKSGLGLKRLIAGTADINTPSVNILLRLGFVRGRREQVSFTADANGEPIVFEGCAYELML